MCKKINVELYFSHYSYSSDTSVKKEYGDTYNLFGFLLLFLRNLFAIIVMQVRVTTRKTPGIIITHQVLSSRARSARDKILPQDNTSRGRPRPRKLSVDSVVIHEPTLEITTNIIAGIIFGIR